METEAAFVDALVRAGTRSQADAAACLQEAWAIWQGVPPWMKEPDAASVQLLHRDESLTILNIAWPALLITEPHNHNLWASILLYQGRENNVLWTRAGETITAADAVSLGPGDVFSMERDAIHSVHNPVKGITAAIHVYGGDFIGTPKSEWGPEDLVERPRDLQAAGKAFAPQAS